jgi:serine/threonine protein kinase
MATDSLINLQPGTVIDGRFEIIKSLGIGSMGQVYACKHRELSGHMVALKVLFQEVATDPVASTRFKNEITASWKINHPNVVRAYDFIRDGDLVGYTMEYVGGGDLADLISDQDSLSISEITRVISQVCSGVQAIHDAGIVHRDLKPENLLLTPDRNIKITDFGIARTKAGPRLTEHGGVVGTLDYVSPEYLEKSEVDTRSDIYAIGIIAYELITHELPFKGNNPVEIIMSKLKTEPTPPHHLRPDCPEKLARIIMKMIARNPDDRYQSSSDIVSDLVSLDVPSEKLSRHGLYSSGAADVGGGISYGYGGGVSVGSGGSSRPAYPDDDYFNDIVDDNVGSLESILAEESPAGKSSGPTPNIAVSNSRLSTDRIKELALSHYRDEEPSMARWVMHIVVIFIVGFGAGLFLIYNFFPSYFEQNSTKSLGVLNQPNKVSADKYRK